MNALLEVQRLGAVYGKVQALHDINIRVHAGQIVTVIGPNGAGKTTLLNSLIGLLPCRGTVRYAAADVSACAIEERVKSGLCLVPERRELFGGLRVEDNLLLGAFPRISKGMRAIRSDLDDVFDRFPRLRERRNQLAGTLSGGERQMLAIGRALMAKPHLLMLDEPSLGLAPRIVRDIFHIIVDLKQSGVSILLVEQNARAALQVADYGYVLETGEIVLEGAAQALSANPRVAQTYLGMSGRFEGAAS